MNKTELFSLSQPPLLARRQCNAAKDSLYVPPLRGRETKRVNSIKTGLHKTMCDDAVDSENQAEHNAAEKTNCSSDEFGAITYLASRKTLHCRYPMCQSENNIMSDNSCIRPKTYKF